MHGYPQGKRARLTLVSNLRSAGKRARLTTGETCTFNPGEQSKDAGLRETCTLIFGCVLVYLGQPPCSVYVSN